MAQTGTQQIAKGCQAENNNDPPEPLACRSYWSATCCVELIHRDRPRLRSCAGDSCGIEIIGLAILFASSRSLEAGGEFSSEGTHRTLLFAPVPRFCADVSIGPRCNKLYRTGWGLSRIAGNANKVGTTVLVRSQDWRLNHGWRKGVRFWNTNPDTNLRLGIVPYAPSLSARNLLI